MNNKVFGAAILMDLSKTFNILKQDLLITKLHAYGFQHNALKLLYSYLNKRCHRIKVIMSFCSQKESIKSGRQGCAGTTYLIYV